MEYEKGFRTVQESVTEWTKCVRYEDINGSRRLFGGRLMTWIDEIAGVTALRHSGCMVTTAAVDRLEFKKGASINDIVVLVARVTHVGRTSMEVRVDTYVEDRETGMRQVINRAYLTEVCVDEKGNPILVPYGLEFLTETEMAENEGAEKRIENRKTRKSEGY